MKIAIVGTQGVPNQYGGFETLASFLAKPLPTQFSLEKDYLEKYAQEGKFYGNIQEAYFIDIGIPEDFAKAQIELI